MIPRRLDFLEVKAKTIFVTYLSCNFVGNLIFFHFFHLRSREKLIAQNDGVMTKIFSYLPYIRTFTCSGYNIKKCNAKSDLKLRIIVFRYALKWENLKSLQKCSIVLEPKVAGT